MKKIILASGSPRRKMLLEWAEIDCTVVVKEIEETYPEGMPIASAPVHIARNKALAAQSLEALQGPDFIIVAADTVVVLGEEIIGKPRNREEAVGILKRLSGKTHQVITGVAVLAQDKEVLFADTTAVEFYRLTEQQIQFYVDKYKPYDKAGAYAIQEWIGVIGIKSIRGDFYNVMGLPVSRLVNALNDFR